MMTVLFQPPPLHSVKFKGIGASLGPEDFVCLSVSPYMVLGPICMKSSTNMAKSYLALSHPMNVEHR